MTTSPPVIHTPGPALPPPLNHKLLTEIGWLIGHETDAVNRAAKALALAKQDGLGFDAHWDAVLAILHRSAALSRVFWPASKKPAVITRGRFLRDLFELGSDSALNPDSRDLRNTIEHWDERLDADEWYLAMDSKYRRLVIGPFTDLQPDEYTLRAYDPTTDTARCGTDELPIRPLVKESGRIYFRYCQVVSFLAHGDPIWTYE